MKNIKYIVCALGIGLLSYSCELTILPENKQSSYQYWNTKEDISAVLAAGYIDLRNSVEMIYLWGEARGNGIEYNATSGSDFFGGGRKLRAMDILPENRLCEWSSLYKIISMANAVIKYAPTVVEKDPSFDQNVCNSYLAEAYFLRSLAYFYIVRTFHSAPFVVEPYVDDSAPYSIAKTDGTIILNSCIKDLNDYIEYSKLFFSDDQGRYNLEYTKGRATRMAFHALLADIHLWLGEYQNCILHCNEIVNYRGLGGVALVKPFFSNFYNKLTESNGNSAESILEIQYSQPKSQTNSFNVWFSSIPTANMANTVYYRISDHMKTVFVAEEGDVLTNAKRGLLVSYTDRNYIWKYVGIDTDVLSNYRNSSVYYDQNFILYRLADVLLMQAEAYVMQDQYDLAIGLVNEVRARVGLSALTLVQDRLAMLEIVLLERQKELFSEGKNWFDMLRVGMRSIQLGDERYKSMFIEQALKAVGPASQSLGRATLSNSGSWFLPFADDEIKDNPLLIQSDYYQSISN